MKQSDDVLTIEMPLPIKRGRGRPSTGVAMSNAQRQAARRSRLAESGEKDFTVRLPADLVQALEKFMQFKDETQSQVITRLLKDRLMRKR